MAGRCRICDFHETVRSDYHHLPTLKNKVRFYEKQQEYLCDACAKEVQSTILEYYKEDDDIPLGEFTATIE